MEALAAFLPEQVVVFRDGHRRRIDARLVVPGDVIGLEEGERVP